MYQSKWTLFSLLGLSVAVSLSALFAKDDAGADKKERLFEMRTYVAAPGKLEALHARFRDHTNKLFKKHGMELIGYWTPVDGDEAKDTLVYILAHANREARDKSFKAFIADPEWNKAKTESEKDGKLVAKVIEKFLKPTDYSPIK